MARRPRSGLARVRPGSDSAQDRLGVAAIPSNLCVSTSADCSGGVKKYCAHRLRVGIMAAHTVDYAGIQGHVYTLLLEGGKYYVGWSKTIENRIRATLLWRGEQVDDAAQTNPGAGVRRR